MNLRRLIRFACAAVFLACSSLPTWGAEIAELTATLISPHEVKLEWINSDPKAAGYIVEYDTDPHGEFVILAFCPAGNTSYVHPRLVPQTKFYYRVRPYYGDASAPVTVTVAEGVTDEAYAAAYALPEDYSWAAPNKNPEPATTARASLKTSARFAMAAPADLAAEVIKTTSSGFRLTWIDHATDEEGFLIERKQGDDRDFSVCAMVEPDVNAFGWAFEPPQRTGTFRVRAFYFGEKSNMATQTTGEGPPQLDEPVVAPSKKPH